MPELVRLVAMTLPSDPARLREARRWIARLAQEAGLEPGACHELAVAFGEIAANVHRHAYGGRLDGRVELRVGLEAERVVVTILHEGSNFDPLRYIPPDLARAAEGGYGIYLVTRLVDEVSFGEAGASGRIVLVKRRRHAAVRS